MSTAARQLSSDIDEAFPYKVCINLDRRPDRWQKMERKFDQHGIRSVRRFAALDGRELIVPRSWKHTPGSYGCLRSHLEVIREARRRGVNDVLIFEDDVVFDPRVNEEFACYFKQLPDDWDMLFFGALHKDQPIRISENIARITKANSTYAYAVRNTVYDAFVELNGRAETVLDHNTFELQRRFNCYCFMPNLAWVETDYSDAQDRVERHWYLEESLVLYGAEMDRLLSETAVVLAYNSTRSGRHDVENLIYLAGYYKEFFSPFISIVVVEQGVKSTVDRSSLPENCAYAFLQDEGPFNKPRCFEAGIEASGQEKKYVILSDSDVYLETLDIRANLLMSERYDRVTGFTEIIDLSEEASRELRLKNTTCGIDIAPNRNGSEAGSWFIRRLPVRFGAQPSERGHSRAGKQSRLFRSPNHALRLH